MLIMHKIFLLLVVVLVIPWVEAIELKWKNTVDFDDPDNWNGEGVVCANDRKKYPRNMTASIVIQQDESLQEMMLSDNMVLTIAEGASLTFTNQPNVVSSPSEGSDSPCIPKGRVLEFMATSHSWFDPNAWEATPPTDQPSDQIDGPLAKFEVFDLDRVPCGQDQAVFDSKHSFLVDMQNHPVQVAAIDIHGQNLTDMDSLNKYLTGEQVKYEFMNGRGITVSSTASCPNYEDRSSLVCGNVKCEAVTGLCSHPVIPTIGQCCNSCGAIIYITTNDTAPLPFGQLAGLGDTEGITLAVGPLQNRVYELLLTDNVNGTNATVAACKMVKRLENNEHVDHVDATLSEGDCSEPITPKAIRKDPNYTNYIIVGVASGCVLLIIILTAIGIVLYRRKSPKDKHAAYELGDVNVSSQGFDNPVYNSPLPYDDNFAIHYRPEDEQVHGFESSIFSPGADSGVSVPDSSRKLPEKKLPLGDAGTASELPSKRSSKKSKSKKEPKPKMETSFENPNYGEAGPLPVKKPLPSEEKADSMVDVPLDEESSKRAAVKDRETQGIVNPLYGDEDSSSTSREEPIEALPQVSVVHTQPSKKKKKKSKGGKSADGAYKSFEDDNQTENIESFQNPLYDQSFYQPEVDEDPSESSQAKDASA